MKTDSQILEDRITKAATRIADHWPHMLPTRPTSWRPSIGGASPGILGDNTEPDRVDTQGRPSWSSDHTDTDTDMTPLDRVVSLRRHVTEELNGWCRVIIEDRPVTHHIPAGHDTPGMCDFLTRHAQWFSGHEAAPDCADELEAAARKIGRYAPPPVTDRPRPPRRIMIGTCPIEWPDMTGDSAGHLRPCEGEVFAQPSGLTDPTRAERIAMRLPTCDKCGTEATVDWWYSVMYADADLSHLVTVHELIGVIAARLEWVVTRDQVRQWKARGKIATEGKDAKGRTLYRHDAVIEAIRDDVERQKAKA